MAGMESTGPVVVGIDGSRAAIEAAKWAIDEATNRDVALRLIHVISIGQVPIGPTEDFRLETEYAESALRAASKTVEANGRPVKVETAVLRGEAADTLIAESLGSSLICLGSVGIGWIASVVVGSTAATVAKHAHCPVAIIRSDNDGQLSDRGWIAVVVDDDSDNETVVQTAMEEARLRHASVLALGASRWHLGEVTYDELDRRVSGWARQYPDVHILPVAARSGAVHYLESHYEPAQLVVVGRGHADQVARLVGPHSIPIRAHADCSVLVVRH
jgi:nucleotide-binding universal stress UspA family protein